MAALADRLLLNWTYKGSCIFAALVYDFYVFISMKLIHLPVVRNTLFYKVKFIMFFSNKSDFAKVCSQSVDTAETMYV